MTVKSGGMFNDAVSCKGDSMCIVKQFCIEKKSTQGTKKGVIFDVYSELNRKQIAVQHIGFISVMLEALTPHLLRIVRATHCKEQRGNGVSINWTPQTTSLWLVWHKEKQKQKTVSFHALLATVQTPPAGLFCKRFQPKKNRPGLNIFCHRTHVNRKFSEEHRPDHKNVILGF